MVRHLRSAAGLALLALLGCEHGDAAGVHGDRGAPPAGSGERVLRRWYAGIG
ncbi:MAG TPA: hypothetical protein VMR44_11055 [Thermoanaerobaculia bacterium]|nr:hypothetical protein [Thermoanaerobaculia bacterium]